MFAQEDEVPGTRVRNYSCTCTAVAGISVYSSTTAVDLVHILNLVLNLVSIRGRSPSPRPYCILGRKEITDITTVSF